MITVKEFRKILGAMSDDDVIILSKNKEGTSFAHLDAIGEGIYNSLSDEVYDHNESSSFGDDSFDAVILYPNK